MYKIIGVDLKEYGPVEAEQLRRWVKEGRVDAGTKVQRDGESDWKCLQELPELAVSLGFKGSWKCPKCGEQMEEQFDSCWRCSTPRSAMLSAEGTLSTSPPALPPKARQAKWRVEYQTYRGTLASWQELFNQAADFATDIGRERLIGISHSEDKSDGVVTVWFWSTNSETHNGG